jgi:hypothetical protein
MPRARVDVALGAQVVEVLTRMNQLLYPRT